MMMMIMMIMIMMMVFLEFDQTKISLKMILDSEKWKKVEQLLHHGKMKTSLGFLASGYTEFLSNRTSL